MRYYYADHENAVRGPLDLLDLGTLFKDGSINAETQVVPEGETEWTPYHRVVTLPAPPAASMALVLPATDVLHSLSVMPPSMPTTQRCPFCDEEISPQAKKCKHCGEILDVTLRAAEEAKRSASVAPAPMVFMNSSSAAVAAPPVLVLPSKSGLVAALLNLLLPGLGYMYCGRVLLGCFVFLFTVGASVVTFGLALFVLYPVFIIDGFLAASRANRRMLVYR